MKADPHPLPGNDQRNVKMSENFRCSILNLAMHTVLIHAVLGKFAYLRLTGYAYNILFYLFILFIMTLSQIESYEHVIGALDSCLLSHSGGCPPPCLF